MRQQDIFYDVVGNIGDVALNPVYFASNAFSIENKATKIRLKKSSYLHHKTVPMIQAISTTVSNYTSLYRLHTQK